MWCPPKKFVAVQDRELNPLMDSVTNRIVWLLELVQILPAEVPIVFLRSSDLKSVFPTQCSHKYINGNSFLQSKTHHLIEDASELILTLISSCESDQNPNSTWPHVRMLFNTIHLDSEYRIENRANVSESTSKKSKRE